MDRKVLLRIDSLLKHINRVLDDTDGLTLEELEKSDLLVRATCFSIVQIGEMMNQLEKTLGDKYDQLPWIDARNMRNFLVHDYGNTDVEQLYATIHNDLPLLNASFCVVKNDVVKGTLVSKRLVLRAIKKEDAESIYNNWASDPEVTKFLTWQTHKNPATTQKIVDEWVKEYKDEPKTFRFGIALKDSEELIGAIDVVDFKDHCPELGYCLSRKYWNNGYMTEACQTFIKYLFDIGYKKITICAKEDNIASMRVIEKCGFHFTHKETRSPWSSCKPETVIINHYELVKN